jgi:hypothetical protein
MSAEVQPGLLAVLADLLRVGLPAGNLELTAAISGMLAKAG